MKLYNLKDSNECLNFKQAVLKGLGRDQGLFFPKKIDRMPDLEALFSVQYDFQTRSVLLLKHLIGDCISFNALDTLVRRAFNFDLKLKSVDDSVFALELFHGPTLAFKDFGARFLAECLAYFKLADTKLTILSATSGDTGAAVAAAFYGMEGIDVNILYPSEGVPRSQSALFTSLGDNIRSFSVDGDFDVCQSLVKRAFEDKFLQDHLVLNSANSINIARLYAQVCYYFEMVALSGGDLKRPIYVSVPCGNYGNLTAGLIARALGLTQLRFIIGNNSNDTVPRYLKTGVYAIKPTLKTLANAMDVSAPSNWVRSLYLLNSVSDFSLQDLDCFVLNDFAIVEAMKILYQKGYLSEPHAAIAYAALEQFRPKDALGVFLGTAAPSKFHALISSMLGISFDFDPIIEHAMMQDDLSLPLNADYDQLVQYLI